MWYRDPSYLEFACPDRSVDKKAGAPSSLENSNKAMLFLLICLKFQNS